MSATLNGSAPPFRPALLRAPPSTPNYLLGAPISPPLIFYDHPFFAIPSPMPEITISHPPAAAGEAPPSPPFHPPVPPLPPQAYLPPYTGPHLPPPLPASVPQHPLHPVAPPLPPYYPQHLPPQLPPLQPFFQMPPPHTSLVPSVPSEAGSEASARTFHVKEGDTWTERSDPDFAYSIDPELDDPAAGGMIVSLDNVGFRVSLHYLYRKSSSVSLRNMLTIRTPMATQPPDNPLTLLVHFSSSTVRLFLSVLPLCRPDLHASPDEISDLLDIADWFDVNELVSAARAQLECVAIADPWRLLKIASKRNAQGKWDGLPLARVAIKAFDQPPNSAIRKNEGEEWACPLDRLQDIKVGELDGIAPEWIVEALRLRLGTKAPWIDNSGEVKFGYQLKTWVWVAENFDPCRGPKGSSSEAWTQMYPKSPKPEWPNTFTMHSPTVPVFSATGSASGWQY